MSFRRLLRATVLLSGGSATALALLVVLQAGAAGVGDPDPTVVVGVSVAWWAVAILVGTVVGRGDGPTVAIGRLLADARTAREHPEPRPVRTLLNRLWPLLIATVAAVVAGAWFPQVAGVAAGFAILGALAWRRQDAAVRAIEERDGVEFVVRAGGLLEPIALLRLPGFRRDRRPEVPEPDAG